QWAVEAAELGAGELVVTSVDREGTGHGYDLELTRRIGESVSIPVIACGGAGCLEHILEVVAQGKADAVAVASCLHYDAIQHCRSQDEDYAAEGNTQFLHRQTSFSRIQPTSLQAVKDYLCGQGVDCRWSPNAHKASA
ncbi:MAG: imidazole glycerol phosphate synthase subunit HisF, partial [Planctomycetes bacterium]|nr:imidazole glycerol phosphate synthase subunit HisF [Planctomycetota bacterium]